MVWGEFAETCRRAHRREWCLKVHELSCNIATGRRRDGRRWGRSCLQEAGKVVANRGVAGSCGELAASRCRLGGRQSLTRAELHEPRGS